MNAAWIRYDGRDREMYVPPIYKGEIPSPALMSKRPPRAAIPWLASPGGCPARIEWGKRIVCIDGRRYDSEYMAIAEQSHGALWWAVSGYDVMALSPVVCTIRGLVGHKGWRAVAIVAERK